LARRQPVVTVVVDPETERGEANGRLKDVGGIMRVAILLSGKANSLAAASGIVLGVICFCAAGARAELIDFTIAQQFAVLGEATSDQTNFNEGTITGDIGIGSPRQFTISNASVVGNIRFSGASNTSGLSPDPDPGSNPGPFTVSGGGTVSGGVVANDPLVTQALQYINDLSQAIGANAGTATTITSGGSINASAGTLGTTASVDGNPLGTYRVFTVTSANFPNGTFTVNGGATDQVVLNLATGGNVNLHGRILLAGGITADQVVINMFGGNYTTHTGANSLDVNTNGLSTFGVFLDPNGKMSTDNADIQGRWFGGDSTNQQIVSGADITAPPPSVNGVPLPAPFLAGAVLIGGLGVKRLCGRRSRA
jgi:hypothetical protein